MFSGSGCVKSSLAHSRWQCRATHPAAADNLTLLLSSCPVLLAIESAVRKAMSPCRRSSCGLSIDFSTADRIMHPLRLPTHGRGHRALDCCITPRKIGRSVMLQSEHINRIIELPHAPLSSAVCRWAPRTLLCAAIGLLIHTQAASAGDPTLNISIGVRETFFNGGPQGPIGSNGGTTGGIEWINLDGQTLVLDGTWQLFSFFFIFDPVTAFAGVSANSILEEPAARLSTFASRARARHPGPLCCTSTTSWTRSASFRPFHTLCKTGNRMRLVRRSRSRPRDSPVHQFAPQGASELCRHRRLDLLRGQAVVSAEVPVCG
jgi:hypothetical protein